MGIYKVIEFASGEAVEEAGFLNAMAYMGSALSTYAIGLLVQWRGWQTTMLTWICCAALALVLCLPAVKKVKAV